MSGDDQRAPAGNGKRRWGRALGRSLLFTVGPVAVAVAGAYAYATGGRYVSTENAYIKADKIVVSTDVSGRVAEVAVKDNDVVTSGQLLFRLDDETFRIALVRAQADLAAAKHDIEAMRALHRQKTAEMKIAEEDAAYFLSAFERSEKLSRKGIVSRAKFDEVRRNLTTARQRLVVLSQGIARVVANLGGAPALPIDKHPRVLAASAARDRAALDLRRTSARAPTAAVVTNMHLQVGEYVEAGMPVFSLVGTKAVWVEANLKETALTHVRVGQKAEVSVDAYPDRTWSAVVDGINPATGAEFALLPPQNSSGNWVKVVQRLPVRLEIKTAPGDPPLRAGMSVVVEIDTGHERVLPGVVASALAWVRHGR